MFSSSSAAAAEEEENNEPHIDESELGKSSSAAATEEEENRYHCTVPLSSLLLLTIFIFPFGTLVLQCIDNGFDRKTLYLKRARNHSNGATNLSPSFGGKLFSSLIIPNANERTGAP